jgi:hypothetical protein
MKSKKKIEKLDGATNSKIHICAFIGVLITSDIDSYLFIQFHP